MAAFRKRPFLLAATAAASVVAASARSDETMRGEAMPDAATLDEAVAGDRIDALMAELAAPETRDWRRVEAEVLRAWSQSGSDAMDLLLERGRSAIAEQDYDAAVEHLTALVDHAPDFAEGWNARATAFYLQGEYGLALADIERVLALNPEHFMALAGLGIIFEGMGDRALALAALRASEKINPHRDDMRHAIERLERELGGAEL